MHDAAAVGPMTSFEESMFEVRLEDTLGSMSVAPERWPAVCWDHRRHGQIVLHGAMEAVARMTAQAGRRPLPELDGPGRESYLRSVMFLYAAALVDSRDAAGLASEGRVAWDGEPGDDFRWAMVEVEVEDAFGRLDSERTAPWGNLIPGDVESVVTRHRWIGPNLHAGLLRWSLAVASRVAPEMTRDDSEANIRCMMEVTADIHVRCLIGLLEDRGTGGSEQRQSSIQ